MIAWLARLAAMVFAFCAAAYNHIFALFRAKADSVIGTRPDIYSLDKAIDETKRDGDTETEMDFSNMTKSKTSIGSILELIVSPQLSEDQKGSLRSYD